MDSPIADGTKLSLSSHAEQRVQQRGIRQWMIQAALEMGVRRYSYGRVLLTLTDRRMEGTALARESGRLRGLTLVIDPSKRMIVTAKWDFRLRKHHPIRKPSRRD